MHLLEPLKGPFRASEWLRSRWLAYLLTCIVKLVIEVLGADGYGVMFIHAASSGRRRFKVSFYCALRVMTEKKKNRWRF